MPSFLSAVTRLSICGTPPCGHLPYGRSPRLPRRGAYSALTPRLGAALSLLVFAVAGCASGTTTTPDPLASPPITPEPSPVETGEPSSPSPVQSAELLADPSPRPFEYRQVNEAPPRRVPNARRAFWVPDPATGEPRQITARLRVQTEHAAVWVQEGLWHDVRKIEEAARGFDSLIYPVVTSAFGSEWTPGIDNDPRVQILHAELEEGILAYVSSGDELPADIYEHSNEAELIVIAAAGPEPGSPQYMALLARELQRLVQWNGDRNEDRWLKDSLADLAPALCGLPVDGLQDAFLREPDVPLTAWSEGTDAARGAGYLLSLYFHELYGDDGTRLLTSEPLNGIAGLDAVLAQLAPGSSFEDLFADWLTATYADHESGLDTTGYSYSTADLARPALAASSDTYPPNVEGSVRQFGADYILLRADDDLLVQFSGAVSTPLLTVSPHSGERFWWTVPADDSLATLTRSFALTNTSQATLAYWTWFDTESGYDFVSLEASQDGGESWAAVARTAENGNEEWSYTGHSGGGPTWIRDQIDLSPYAGSEVLVRFSYLTDAAVLGTGFALDDIRVPEIEWFDGAETDAAAWEARGFVRAGASVRQRYLLLLVGIGEEIAVRRLEVGVDASARFPVPLASEGWREAVLIVSGLAPITADGAPYSLVIEAESPGS
jgi:immune inhibitor A